MSHVAPLALHAKVQAEDAQAQLTLLDAADTPKEAFGRFFGIPPGGNITNSAAPHEVEKNCDGAARFRDHVARGSSCPARQAPGRGRAGAAGIRDADSSAQPRRG